VNWLYLGKRRYLSLEPFLLVVFDEAGAAKFQTQFRTFYFNPDEGSMIEARLKWMAQRWCQANAVEADLVRTEIVGEGG
jgi:hypothetical protein